MIGISWVLIMVSTCTGTFGNATVRRIKSGMNQMETGECSSFTARKWTKDKFPKACGGKDGGQGVSVSLHRVIHGKEEAVRWEKIMLDVKKGCLENDLAIVFNYDKHMHEGKYIFQTFELYRDLDQYEQFMNSKYQNMCRHFKFQEYSDSCQTGCGPSCNLIDEVSRVCV